MENASKALLMIAGVLLGVLILTIMVYVFNHFGNYNQEVMEEMREKDIQAFNNNFYKFESTTGDIIKVTMHDIVGLVKFAKEYNTKNGVSYGDAIYISVCINGTRIEEETEEQLMNRLSDIEMVSRTDANGDLIVVEKYYFICQEIRTNKNTRRVNYINFRRYEN